jgi:N4-(beta-N-acetylglucosaminyl)-L-asparaginase
MDLFTTRSATMWSEWLSNGQSPNYRKTEGDHVNTKHERHGHDTIGMIAIDSTGSISCGTTTNGASYKVPGRVGDSPIMGAGAYC